MNLGLIGFPLTHSFSKRYFADKFAFESLQGYTYENYALQSVEELPKLIADHPSLRGLNVTIPHKQSILRYMDQLDAEAAAIGAVNTIVIGPDGCLAGYNSDIFGFEESLKRFITRDFDGQALVLGTGGAAKAVWFVLTKLGIPFTSVSRNRKPDIISYDDLTIALMHQHGLIINTTPLGMYPNIEECPAIPYDLLTPSHYLYDLIYNPEETAFMQRGQSRGAQTKNGYEMLVLQAERSWQIWHGDTQDGDPDASALLGGS